MMGMNTNLFQNSRKVLDLGAGTGKSFEHLRRYIPNIEYIGLDIELSPEVGLRTRDDLEFRSYDGKHMPFENSYFDVVFTKQVLEHVRYPDIVIEETSRVLRKDGIFVGACSQLEPYHSYSIFNWTAYGIVSVFKSHGLNVVQLRPGIDGVTLTMRRILGPEKFNAFFSFESIYNHYIEGAYLSSSAEERNFRKLLVAGHINWIAIKQ